MDFCRMHLVYYDCWNSVWTAVFQDGKAFVYAIWHECNWIKGVWKKIGLPVFFYAYHEAAIPLMQIENMIKVLRSRIKYDTINLQKK